MPHKQGLVFRPPRLDLGAATLSKAEPLFESVVAFDAPNASATLTLRKERRLYLALAQMAIQQARVFDAIAQVTETSDFLHAHIIAKLRTKSTEKSKKKF